MRLIDTKVSQLADLTLNKSKFDTAVVQSIVRC